MFPLGILVPVPTGLQTSGWSSCEHRWEYRSRHLQDRGYGQKRGFLPPQKTQSQFQSRWIGGNRKFQRIRKGSQSDTIHPKESQYHGRAHWGAINDVDLDERTLAINEETRTKEDSEERTPRIRLLSLLKVPKGTFSRGLSVVRVTRHTRWILATGKEW